jgi:rare lipoprotein A
MTTTPARSTSRPAPRLRRSRRVLVGGLAGGLAGGLVGGLASAAHAATVTPAAAPAARIAEQAAAAPSPLPRERASRGVARTALPTTTVTREVATGPSFSGQASWYGGSFQGRRTANGETFDTGDLTAASKTLPFGTRLRVCRYGSCVVVRVNDRGPYVGGRVLDLSRAAANQLGYSGVAYVTATPIAVREVTVVDQAALARQRARLRQVRAAHQIRAALKGTPAAPEPVHAAAVSDDSVPAPVPSGAAAGMLLSGAVVARRTRLAA